jgi:hypothetical protein
MQTNKPTAANRRLCRAAAAGALAIASKGAAIAKGAGAKGLGSLLVGGGAAAALVGGTDDGATHKGPPTTVQPRLPKA